jgi:biotin carboxyl carrier protein
MRKFIINVNGNSYEVEVEEVGGATSSVSAPAAAPAVSAAPKKAAAPVGKGTPVKAPMPGTVLDIKVSNGQSVKAGDVLVILEAMKMENEIKAGSAGVVTVVTSKGSSVNTGDVLVTIA